MRIPLLFAMSLILTLLGARQAHAQYDPEEFALKNWAVGILAADWRDSEGMPITAFENARRDLAKGFAEAGFNARNITDLSLRPRIMGGESLSSQDVFVQFEKQAKSVPGGCLFYFTSHGYTHGLTLGNEGYLSPADMNRLINRWCGTRPTVVIVSACYSGVFVPALSAPHRLVVSAARADRSSFGCGAEARYPYFDGCVLESLPNAEHFVDLAVKTRNCVFAGEEAKQLYPPSEPQALLGTEIRGLLEALTFAHPEDALPEAVEPAIHTDTVEPVE